jgi:hypothetical protein
VPSTAVRQDVDPGQPFFSSCASHPESSAALTNITFSAASSVGLVEAPSFILGTPGPNSKVESHHVSLIRTVLEFRDA